MSARRPNLFLLGAMKSGTTYLSGLLGAHPEVFVCSPREPCHFVDQKVLRRAWPEMWEQGYWRSEDRYLGLFATAGEAKVIADASSAYSKAPMFAQVPERILNFNPQARFIYIMRDPVERAISHYWHRVRWWGERRSMLSAIRSDPQYVDVSYYALQLSAYLRHVSRSRVYVLTHEALLADPDEQLARVYVWLGVASSFRPPSIGVPTNVRPELLDQVRGVGLLEIVRRAAWYGSLAPRLPRAARKLGSKLAVRSVRPADVPDAEVRDYLREVQLPQTNELSRMLNRTFPEWNTLYAASGHPNAAAPTLRRQLAGSSET
jgi:hypothetical protein